MSVECLLNVDSRRYQLTYATTFLNRFRALALAHLRAVPALLKVPPFLVIEAGATTHHVAHGILDALLRRTRSRLLQAGQVLNSRLALALRPLRLLCAHALVNRFPQRIVADVQIRAVRRVRGTV